MAFASIYVPNFMVQTIVRAEPDLRDRAVALVDGCSPLWKIVAANEAALREGIELGMGGSQALQFAKWKSGIVLRSRKRLPMQLCWTWGVCISAHRRCRAGHDRSRSFRPDLVI